MILLRINTGFGNADCGTLPLSAVDLGTGWSRFPRPKTGIDRRCPLWPETVEALKTATAERPTPKDKADGGLVFTTKYGHRRVRVQPKKPKKQEQIGLEPVTGLPSRTAFEVRLEAALSAAEAAARGAACVLFDLDFLRRVNRAVGDRRLIGRKPPKGGTTNKISAHAAGSVNSRRISTNRSVVAVVSFLPILGKETDFLVWSKASPLADLG